MDITLYSNTAIDMSKLRDTDIQSFAGNIYAIYMQSLDQAKHVIKFHSYQADSRKLSLSILSVAPDGTEQRLVYNNHPSSFTVVVCPRHYYYIDVSNTVNYGMHIISIEESPAPVICDTRISKT